MRNVVDTSVFTDPVQVPEDGDLGDGTAFQLAPQSLANRTRYLKDQLTVAVSVLGNEIAALGKGEIPLSNFGWRSSAVDASTVHWIPNNAGKMISVHASPRCWYPLDDVLVAGCTIVSAKLRIKPGAARTGTDKIQFSLIKRDIFSASATDWSSAIAAAVDDGTLNLQTITCSPGEVTVAGFSYALMVIGGSDADTNLDALVGGSVTLA